MGKKYSEEFLISEFWRFYEENKRYPYSKEMSKNGYPSITAYKRIWGSWESFLKHIDVLGEDDWYKCDEQVIIDMYEDSSQEDILNKLMIKRKWNSIKHKASKMGIKRSGKAKQKLSDDFLLSELKRYFNLYGRTPLYNDYEYDKDFPSATVYKKRFGTWNKALQLAGLEVNIITDHSKEQIKNEIIEFYNNQGRSPYYYELKYSLSTINKYWNGWTEAIKDCGIPLNRKETILKNKEDGILFLQELSKEIDRIPTVTEIDENYGVFRGWFRDNFGSYDQALFEAGLIDEVIDKDDLLNKCLNELINLYKKFGSCPTVSEYDEYARNNGLLNRKALEYHLELNYNEICMKYLGVANQYQRSKEEIYQKLLEIKEILGRSPMSQEIASYGLDVRACSRAYGMKFNDMIETFGWEISGNKVNIKTTQEMLDDYFNLYHKLNRLPLMNDINAQDDMCNYSTYYNRFGDLTNIWITLGINYEEEISKGKYGYLCVDNNGELCKSYREMIISNILIYNNIKFIKEYPYNNLISGANQNKRFDWYLPEYNICVEFFGLFNENNLEKEDRFGQYARKTLEKINLCKENNINLLSLYLNDLENNFKILIFKFKEFGIELVINNEILKRIS